MFQAGGLHGTFLIFNDAGQVATSAQSHILTQLFLLPSVAKTRRKQK